MGYVRDYDYRTKQKADFRATRRVEQLLSRQLRKIAQHIGMVVEGIADGTLESAVKIGELMARYAETLVPWAEASLRRIHQEIDSRDKRQWRVYSREIGELLRDEINKTDTGTVLRGLMSEQVSLIRSLPLEAAQRVHELTLRALSEGERKDEIVADIMRTGDVTRSRAVLIARTETARTASLLTQTRAQAVGSTHYVWRTARDAGVRPSHRRLEGKSFPWNEPPVCDPPAHRANPGQIWNCRCWAEPVIPRRQRQ